MTDAQSPSPIKAADNTEDVVIGGRHTPLDYLFFTRPVLMPPVWTIALLGAASVSPRSITWYDWAVLIVQLWCLFGAVYTLNQICDVESDRINRKLFFLPDSLIPMSRARTFTIALNIVAVSLACLFGYEYVIFTIVIVLLGIVYSVGRWPWKNNPILGYLTNVIAHGSIVYMMGAVFAGGTLSASWLGSLPYAIAVGGVYLATTVADIPGDRASGKRTIGVWIGARATMIVAALSIAGALVLASALDELPMIVAAAVVLPVYGWATGGNLSRRAPKAARWAVASLSLVTVLYFPTYAILLILGFIGARTFFLWRFGMTYPRFR